MKPHEELEMLYPGNPVSKAVFDQIREAQEKPRPSIVLSEEEEELYRQTVEGFRNHPPKKGRPLKEMIDEFLNAPKGNR